MSLSRFSRSSTDGDTLSFRIHITPLKDQSAPYLCSLNSDLDILKFPAGAVVLTRTANPKLAVLLNKAAGIIAEKGDVTGHLATVAREIRIPALFGTGSSS